MKEGWKFVSMIHGEQFVMIVGEVLMLLWYVNN